MAEGVVHKTPPKSEVLLSFDGYWEKVIFLQGCGLTSGCLRTSGWLYSYGLISSTT